MTGSNNRRISKIRGGTQDDIASPATTLPWRHKNLALPVTQFTGPDAPRSPHHARAKSANGVKGSARRCT
jgi:hypothetical protein